MTVQSARMRQADLKHRQPRRHKRFIDLDAIVGGILILTLFGYPLISTLPTFLSLETRLVSVPYRAFVGAMTILALVLSLLNQRRTRVPMCVRALVAVSCLVLVLRFAYETFALNLPPGPTQSVEEFTLFFFGVTLLPALALFLPLRAETENRIYSALVAFGFVTVTLVVIASTFLNPKGDPSIRSDLEGLNAISYAVTGAFLVLLTWPSAMTGKASVRAWWICVCGTALGLVPVLTAGSKGPFISLIAVLATSYVISRKGKRSMTILLLLIAGAGLVIGAGEWVKSITESGSDTIAIAQRLSDVSDDGSTVERLIILNSSWDVFTANPLLGGAMVEPTLLAYPHNILLEALMVGGIPFGIITLTLFIATTVQAIRLMASPANAPLRRFIGMFTLYVLLMSMMSGSLYKGPEFWAAIVISFSFRSARPIQRRLRRANSHTAIQHPAVAQLSRP